MSPELFREIALKIARHQDPCDTFLGLYNYGEPLLHPKLAEILEISIGTVRSRLSRARNQLKVTLEAMENEEESMPGSDSVS